MSIQPKVIALGFFDGVHLGHGALLRRTAEEARRRGVRSAVFTWAQPPKEVVTGVPVPLINSPEDRAWLAKSLYGIDDVIMVPFNKEMMTTSWEDFVTEILIKRYHAVHLVAGHDHRFGHKNQGTPELLKSKCAELGLGCDIIPEVTVGGITVSSTYIRRLVSLGQVERAMEYLGHPHILTQTVRHGRRIGHTIGIPTVNLVPQRIIDGTDFLSDIALAFIAFSTGEFFKLSVLKRNGMKVVWITILEAVLASVAVFVLTYWV